MEIARLYRDAQGSFVEFVSTLGDDEWHVPVPCTPGWTVRDVLSHVAGLTDDVLAGRVEGAATDPWTAAQVERWKDADRDELIGRWNEQIDPVADAIEAFGEARPVFDCHTHEHDVRHALDRPGNRDSEIMQMIVTGTVGRWQGRHVIVDLVDGSTLDMPGSGGEPLRLGGVTQFDVARSRLGRRSRRQVEQWAWSEPPGDVLDHWFDFGPSEVDIVE